LSQRQPTEQLLPFVKLLIEGELLRSAGNVGVFEKTLAQSWANMSGKGRKIVVTERGKSALAQYLDNTWPGWSGVVDELAAAGLPLSMDGVKELERQKRATSLNLPKRAHHKTLAAVIGAHSKTGLGARHQGIIKDTLATTDQTLRLRANKDLKLEIGNQFLDCDLVMQVLGEVVIPERALLDGLTVSGCPPQVVMTVENLGTYVDMAIVREDLLVIHTPGKNTALTIAFMGLLKESLPHLHFGDLDPEGLNITKILDAGCAQKLTLFAPDFWEESIDSLSGFCQWPKEIPVGHNIPLIERLRREGRWLEQERITLDPRLKSALRSEINRLLSKEGH